MNWDYWDLVDTFTLGQAAYLWCGIEPVADGYITFGFKRPEVLAIAQFLKMAVQNGDIEAGPDHMNYRLNDPNPRTNTLDAIGMDHKLLDALVSRADLQKLAESKGQKPAFLFPEMRATPES